MYIYIYPHPNTMPHPSSGDLPGPRGGGGGPLRFGGNPPQAQRTATAAAVAHCGSGAPPADGPSRTKDTCFT